MKFNYKIIAIAISISLTTGIAKAQVSEGGTPLGISQNLSINEIPVIQMSETPVDELIVSTIVPDVKKTYIESDAHSHNQTPPYQKTVRVRENGDGG